VRILVDIVESELKALDKMAKSEKVSLRSSAKLSTIFWIVMIRQKRQKLSGSGVIERSMGSNTRIKFEAFNAIPEARDELDRYGRRAISIITWMEALIGADPDVEAATRSFE
jgi:hypothetical protein